MNRVVRGQHGGKRGEGETMAEGVELIQRFYDDVIGKGDLDVVTELTADGFVDHEEGLPGQPSGLEGVKFFVNTMREAFPDIKATVGESLEEGSLASAHVTLSGTHRGEVMGVPASDKTVEIGTIESIRVEAR